MAEIRRYVSPIQVSRALGVSETTVKRWVDEGRLPAHRTPGGHRKILVSDVVELVQREELPQLDLALLTDQPCSTPSRCPVRLSQALYDALLAGRENEAVALLRSAHDAGLSVARLGDEVVGPAMVRVGRGWETCELDVYQEHRCTQTCLVALMALKSALNAKSSPQGPLALGGCPECDHSFLANLLVEMTLCEEGWRTINIGPNTPFVSFEKALLEHRPRLLWISCSHMPDSAAFLAGYQRLFTTAAELGTAIAAGGRGISEPISSQMLFAHHGTRLAQLVAFVRQLHPGQLQS